MRRYVRVGYGFARVLWRCGGFPELTNGSMSAWLCLGFCRGTTFRFFGRRRIGAMSDRGHHGEGEHHQGNVAMPAMPLSALVVIEPELVFRGLEAVLDCTPVAFDRHQRFDKVAPFLRFLLPTERPAQSQIGCHHLARRAPAARSGGAAYPSREF
jgi:hypothetical protein